MIVRKEYYFKTIDGLGLYAQSWNNGQKPKALICLVHGLGDHSGRFDNWAELFVQQGYAVSAYDLRGNGKSQGKRGFSPSYKLLLKDMELFIKESKRRFSNLPVFLYGHSLGGNLAINYVIKEKPEIQGLITTSPWLKLHFEPNSFLIKAGKYAQHFLPWLTVSTGLSREDLNGETSVINNYDQDKYLHNRIALKLFLDAHKNGLWALKNIYRINVPFLMVFGKEDKIVSYRACEEYVNNTSEKTKLILLEGCKHNLYNGINHLKIHKIIVNWLQENCIIARTKVKADEFVPH